MSAIAGSIPRSALPREVDFQETQPARKINAADRAPMQRSESRRRRTRSNTTDLTICYHSAYRRAASSWGVPSKEVLRSGLPERSPEIYAYMQTVTNGGFHYELLSLRWMHGRRFSPRHGRFLRPHVAAGMAMYELRERVGKCVTAKPKGAGDEQ